MRDIERDVVCEPKHVQLCLLRRLEHERAGPQHSQEAAELSQFLSCVIGDGHSPLIVVAIQLELRSSV